MWVSVPFSFEGWVKRAMGIDIMECKRRGLSLDQAERIERKRRERELRALGELDLPEEVGDERGDSAGN